MRSCVSHSGRRGPKSRRLSFVMKLRLKLGSRRLVVVLPQTTAESSLQSLKQHIAQRGLAPETCELSLSGTEALDETRSLGELGIVSGDLIHVLARDEDDGDGITSRSLSYQPPLDEKKEEEEDAKMQLSSQSEPSLTMTHYQEFCLSLSTHGEKRSSPPRVRLTQTTALSTALHCLMLDAGFTTKENGHVIDDTSAKWSYTTPVCDEVKVHLACLRMGHLLSIHGMAKLRNDKVAVSLTLQVSSHIGRDTGSGVWVLQKPSELAVIFKDRVAHRVLTGIRKVLGLPEVGTFSSLFPELKLLVCRRLDVRSLLALSQVCKELHSLCNDQFLWKNLLFKDFGKRSVLSAVQSNISWKQLYIDHFKAAIERRLQSSIIFPLFPPNPLPLFTPPPLPSHPLIIGGGHDLLPEIPERLHLAGESPPLHHRWRHHPEIRDHMIRPLPHLPGYHHHHHHSGRRLEQPAPRGSFARIRHVI